MSVTFSVPNTNVSMNVSNGSAAKILFDLLGFARGEFDGPWGDLDPADVIRRLALHEVRLVNAVESPSESRGTYIDQNGVADGCLVLSQGYSVNRLMRYVTQLKIMADQALQQGEVITFG